ncbi:hypothetical protein ACFHWW_34230, partial [Ensifer sp. P24N7]
LVVFGREIGSERLSEGVEPTSELETLRRLGVTKAQGYLLGRPMPLQRIPANTGDRGSPS